jgi:hypothetical protein
MEPGSRAGGERRIRFTLDEERGDPESQPAGLLEDQKREAAFARDEAEMVGQTLSRFRLSRA